MAVGEERGLIVQAKEGDSTVIYKLVDEVPGASLRAKFRWLTVIAWKYNGSVRNGMPPENINKQMITLEDAIGGLERKGLCLHAYSRTGNELKELVYYITDRDQFMAAFNNAVKAHPSYPIEIEFFEDEDWQDFKNILGLFKKP